MTAHAAADAALLAELFQTLAVSVRPLAALQTCVERLAAELGVSEVALFALSPQPVVPGLPPSGHTPSAPAAEALRLLAPAQILLLRGAESASPAVLDVPPGGAGLVEGLALPRGGRLLCGVTEGEPVAALLLADGSPDDARAQAVCTALLPALTATIYRQGSQRTTYERRFVVALQHAADAIEICNRDAIIEWVNPAFERVTGYRREEAIGRTPGALFRGGQHPPEFYDAIDRVVRSGAVWRGRLLGRRKSGELFPQECTFTPILRRDGDIECVIAIRHDITEKLRAEADERERRNNQVFRSLVEVLPDGVLVLREGQVLLANPALLELLGLPEAALLSGPALTAAVRDDEQQAFEIWLDALDTGQIQPGRRTWHFVRSDRRELLLELTPVPWASYEGGAALVVVATDLTERQQLQSRLLMADRLSAMGMLLAGIGHEINNPLSYVHASLELLRIVLPPVIEYEPEDVRDEVSACLSDAWDGVRRIAGVVSDFRAFSRTSEARGTVDFQRLVKLTARMVQNEVRPRAQLILDIGDIPPFEGEENRIAQVLLNLLINAAQAIPEGDVAHNAVRLKAHAVGRELIVEVSDTGVGIAPELQQRIFDPFFTTKFGHGGTGLGLSICHAIALEFGGDLTVSSEPGSGSTFTFRLPMRPAPKTQPALPLTPSDGASLRVLVIDDEPLVGRAVERLLASNAVEVAVGGQAGLHKLRQGGPWDVVLCDLVMPDVSGADVYEAVRRERPLLANRFVFMSGGAYTPRVRAFVESATAPFLSKPFDQATLNGALRRALEPRPA